MKPYSVQANCLQATLAAKSSGGDRHVSDSYGPYTKPLTGVDRQRSSRVGGWRIIYTVDETQKTVNVSLIASRGEVYRRL